MNNTTKAPTRKDGRPTWWPNLEGQTVAPRETPMWQEVGASQGCMKGNPLNRLLKTQQDKL